MSLLLEQLITFSLLIGAGLAMALVFDLYRFGRWLLRPSKLCSNFFDLVIWLVFAMAVFYILILGNWGEVRFYIFLGLIAGVAMYFKFFSRKVINLLLIIFNFIKKAMGFLLKVLTFPIKIIGKIVIIPLGLLSYGLKQIGKLVCFPVRYIIVVGKKLFLMLTKGDDNDNNINPK